MVTDPDSAAPRSVVEVVAASLQAGAPAVQLRNKGQCARELVAVGRELRSLTRAVGALLFVNDRLDVALAVDADGVHLGPDDLPVAAVRSAAPAGFLIGRSADQVSVARRAAADGADYVGCGTVYSTATKLDAGSVIGLEGLRAVVEGVDIPVVGIGGIDAQRAAEVTAAGAAGVAVVGAVMSANDPGAAVEALLSAGR